MQQKSLMPNTIDVGLKELHVNQDQLASGLKPTRQMHHANTTTSLISKIVKNQLATMEGNNNNNGDEESTEVTGKYMDEEYTIQNFQNVARQGDLSPRLIDRGKTTGKGRKK